jgi:hypothetical protein
MSTLFHEHLCDIRRESLLKAKLEFEKDISYRLVTEVVDKLEDVKERLREQARALYPHVTYTFHVVISDIKTKHAAYLATADIAGNRLYNSISMVEQLLTRRLPHEFSGLRVEFEPSSTTLCFSVYGDL